MIKKNGNKNDERWEYETTNQIIYLIEKEYFVHK